MTLLGLRGEGGALLGMHGGHITDYEAANHSRCETWVPLGPTDHAHGRPRQVGLTQQKTRRPVSSPARPDMWAQRREDSLTCKPR
jgi:hypothetical protein